MRRGANNCWLTTDDGVYMGINLGSDFVAEHEWGIDDLKSILDVPKNFDNIYGIERRRCFATDKKTIALKVEKDVYNLLVMREYKLKNFIEKPVESNCSGISFFSNDSVVTAWDGESLIVRVKGDDNVEKLKILHQSLLAGGCAIWLGGGGFLMNAGLCLAIIDAVPEKSLKVMKDADLDREKLLVAAEKTGIRKKIEEANDFWRKMEEVSSGRRVYSSDKKWGYYALSPKWATKEERRKTKHPVVFWLNPMDQEKNNYGWFTVEELQQWFEDKGPIPTRRGKK